MSLEPATAHDLAYHEIVVALPAIQRRPLVVGLCGSQGSGKSTLAASLCTALCDMGIVGAVLSLDDLYLTRSDRLALAAQVHPLLATRGVPGTHDVALGEAVIAALGQGKAAAAPRFDKARDDRCAPPKWGFVPAATEVLILEGWCVGARAQGPEALLDPVNDLEVGEDPDGSWRRYVNDALLGPYSALFNRIDVLILLAAPSFDVVAGWRNEQEEALRASVGADAPGLMSASGIQRFVSHYERLTRHILDEMPRHADLTIDLDAKRRPVGTRTPHSHGRSQKMPPG